MHLLSLLIWVPIIGAAITLLFGEKQPERAKWSALITVLISMALCIPLYQGFNPATHYMQFVELHAWMPSLKINYALGVDGIALPLVILTAVTSLFVVLAAWRSIHKLIAQYLAAFLMMQGVMTGVFVAQDALLFYIFWEATLIPMYLIIGIWGSDNRIYATIKFFLFTLFGSLLMLIAIIYLGLKANSFAIQDFYPLHIPLTIQELIFVGFFFAFAIKIPMWPVHTWLPDAHTEAPTGGSVVLAALMLKMGGYGFLRFNLPIVPDASQALATVLIALSLVAIVYISLIAIAQTDMKKLIAYSSIAHMGFVTLSFFALFYLIHQAGFDHALLGLEGGYIIMISHAFISSALFLGVGVLYDRLHTRRIQDFGGVAQKMPIFAAFFMLFAMANTGLPGTSGFVGEFLVILSSFKANAWVSIIAATTLILSAAYTLWMYKRVFFSGMNQSTGVAFLTDLNKFEIMNFTLLAILVLWFGLYPNTLFDMVHASLRHLIELSMISKL